MLLIIEIALSIWVSKRGWGRLAFLPLLVGLLLGFIIGFAGAMTGVDPTAILIGALSIDGLMIVSLIAMGVVGRTGSEEPFVATTPSVPLPTPSATVARQNQRLDTLRY